MRGYWFLFGVLVTVFVMLVGGYATLRLGFLDPRADVPVNRIEASVMGPAMDASVARRAPKLENPVAATAPNLAAGAALYSSHCALCHGDPQHPKAQLAEALYPRAPQFLPNPSDMPASQIFYIIQHGVRNTGMPAWGSQLDARQTWQVVTFMASLAGH